MDSERGEETFELKVAGEKKADVQKVGQEQIHGLLFGEQLSWQQIIYDLINSEQLDPWDIDLTILTNRYLEKIRELEEANLFVSSKVLFAAALLLRIKSEIVLYQYLPDLDALLHGKKDSEKYVQERIELEEDVPGLTLRTPLPRHRKVTLQELMAALSHAVTTENRRIKKVVVARQQEIETAISLPRAQFNIKDRIRDVFGTLKTFFSKSKDKVAFSAITGKSKEEKFGTFVPLLYLDSQHKVLLEQEKHLDEIYIWLKQFHEEKHSEALEKLRKEVEEEFAKQIAEDELEEQLEREQEKEKNKNKKKNVGKKKIVGENNSVVATAEMDNGKNSTSTEVEMDGNNSVATVEIDENSATREIDENLIEKKDFLAVKEKYHKDDEE